MRLIKFILVVSKMQTRKKFCYWPLLGSFLLHLLVVVVLGIVLIPSNQIKQSKPVDYQIVTLTPFAKKNIPLPNTIMPSQIVNSSKISPQEKMSDTKTPTRFLGEHTQVVKVQTQAREHGNFHEGTSPNKQKRLAKTNLPKKSLSLKDFRFHGGDVPVVAKVADRTFQETAQIAGTIARNNDYLPDVPLGDITQLNTVEYKYFGFYDRIRKQLEQYWENSLKNQEMQLIKDRRHIPRDQNLITSLIVAIDREGRILQIQIERTSGVQEFDRAAIDSFYKAGPFPNPPTGMIEDGHALLKWGFVVNT